MNLDSAVIRGTLHNSVGPESVTKRPRRTLRVRLLVFATFCMQSIRILHPRSAVEAKKKHLRTTIALMIVCGSGTCLAQIPAFPDEEVESETTASHDPASTIFDPDGTEATQAKIKADAAKARESKLQSTISETAEEKTSLAEGEYYTAYNVWYERPEKIYSINYKKGRVIPAGTKVDRVSVKSGRRGRISFRHIDYNLTYTIYLQAKFHPNMTVEDIRDRLLITEPLSTRTAGMSEVEKEGIQKGIVIPGMSKESVLIALGYPPEHRTPSIKMDDWYYWMNRFRSEIVTFDQLGKATNGLSQ